MYSGNNPSKEKQVKDSSKYPQGYFKEKPCKKCKVVFQPHAPSECLCSDKCKEHAFADNYLKRAYGIDLDEYNLMLIKQNNCCSICKSDGFIMQKGHKVKLVVDHCHDTGKVRGLLCHNCNRALGLLKDNTNTINNALEYINESRK